MTCGASRSRCARRRWRASCGRARHGVRLNEHLEHDCGLTVFHHACKMGLEGIVSKRLGSRYRSGRSPDWLKIKKSEAPAVKREAEEIGGGDAQLHGGGANAPLIRIGDLRSRRSKGGQQFTDH